MFTKCFCVLCVNKIKKWQCNVSHEPNQSHCWPKKKNKPTTATTTTTNDRQKQRWKNFNNITLKQKRNCFGINAIQQKTTLYLYKIYGNVLNSFSFGSFTVFRAELPFSSNLCFVIAGFFRFVCMCICPVCRQRHFHSSKRGVSNGY